MLLLGPPGIGKTHFAREVAKLLGTGMGFISMSSLTAGWVLSRRQQRSGRARGRARCSRRWSTASTPTR
jgi:replication-associated recombination protein RarA